MLATVIECLKGVNAYPIPFRTLVEVGGGRGLDLSQEVTQEILHGKAYNLAVADLLLWLSLAPNVTQGGQSYSFTDEQRTQLKNRARALYDEYGADEASTPKAQYGYKGSRL